MHTLNPDNDSGVDNDLEAAFVKMFEDGSIKIGKTLTTPSSKEALLDRFLPTSIAAEVSGQPKINLVAKSINGITFTAEQQQLDFLKYFNKDEYINFSKELIIDNFVTSYKFPTVQKKAILNALSTRAPGGTETEAELTARKETLMQIRDLDLDPKPSSEETFADFQNIFYAKLLAADSTLTGTQQNEMLDDFIIKIADTALNGLPLDNAQEQKLIFAETMAAILKADDSTAAKVANGTANNIAKNYIPSLNNILAFNNEELAKILKGFAETGKKVEASITAEDVEVFTEISKSPYFTAKKDENTTLYLEMVLSLKSTTPEEKERKDNFRNAFQEIFLSNYSGAESANVANFEGKFNILSSLIKGIPADDKLNSFKILETPGDPNSFYRYNETYRSTDTTDTKDYSGIKLLKNDEADILNYLSTLESSNYALSSLGFINTQRTATPNTKAGNSDVQLQDAKNNVGLYFPTPSDPERTVYINNIDTIDKYVGVNGFDIDAKSSKLNPRVVKVTASLLELSKKLIDFTGDAFNKPAQELERAANYVINSGNPLNDRVLSEDLVINGFITDYKNPNADKQLQLSTLSTKAPGSNETNAEITAITETIKKLSVAAHIPNPPITTFTLFKNTFNAELLKVDSTLTQAQQDEMLHKFTVKIADITLGNPIDPAKTVLAADKISNSINNWLKAPGQKDIYTNNALADNLTSLLRPIINDLEGTDNSILTSQLSTVVNSVASKNISNSQLAARNLFTGNNEDRTTKKLTALNSIYKTGQNINAPVTENDLNFIDKFGDIYQKYNIGNDALYNNIITKFADSNTRTLVNKVLDTLVEEDTNQIDLLSYSARRNGAKFVLNSLNTILSDPTKFIIPGNNDSDRLANLEKSFQANGALNKLYPDAYNDIVNLLLTQQGSILDAKKAAINALPYITPAEKAAKDQAMLQIPELSTARSSVQKIIDYPKDSLTQYFTKQGSKTLGNKFNTKLNEFKNLITSEAADSDVDLLKAYAERSIAGSKLTSNIKTLIEYDGQDGFKLNAIPENLDNSTITTASKLIQLAKDLQQETASQEDLILIKYLENTTNLILNSSGGNRNYLKDFINNTAFTQISSVISGSPKHVRITEEPLKNLLKPYEFINKGINNYDPELMTAYAKLTTQNPSADTLAKFENIITYEGSNGFILNANPDILNLSPADLTTRVNDLDDLINKADELSQIAEFANSSLVGYLERNANLFLNNNLNTTEKTAIKTFTTEFMGSINTTLTNNDLTPSMVNDLLSSFSADSESVDGSSLNYIPYSIQSAEAAGKRNNLGQLLDTSGNVITNPRTQRVDLNGINNAFFKERGFTKTVKVNNIDTIKVNEPKVNGQILLYQGLKTGIQSLLTIENAKSVKDSTKISTLESSESSYTNIIASLQLLLTSP
jgi:hypothetical protein